MVVTGLVSAATKMVSDKLGMDAQNSAAIHAYNQQVDQAHLINRAAINQQVESDSRNRVERMRQSETAADRARAAILENRKAMATARASAGTSGMMGMPLNLVEQNYQALIGGVATNLESYNQQLDENYFFNSMDNMLRAQSISNQAIPMKPYLQKFGAANIFGGVMAGLTGSGLLGKAYSGLSNIGSTGSTAGTFSGADLSSYSSAPGAATGDASAMSDFSMSWA